MKTLYTGLYHKQGKKWREISPAFLFKLAIITLLIFVAHSRINAQALTTTQNSNSQTLSQLLAGPGVTISNYSLSCATNGSGTFTNNSSNLGLNGGVVLATGRVSNVPQVATNFASTQFTLSGDAQLSTLTSGPIYDPCVLQFDIVPQGSLLKFNYVFASEEYPEWVCSQYNDVFGFFISGPKPSGGNYSNQNMAIIPSTALPVAINTINPGTPGSNAGAGTCSGSQESLTYTSYYVNNLTPTVNPNIVYDGMTKVLQASASVIPCQTYHLKLAIADVSDRIYDSGVFLEAYSFTTTPVSISAAAQLNYAGFSSAYEGCVGGTFTVSLSQAQATDMYVNIVVSGTATNGADYDSIPSTVMIPAGQTSVSIPLNPHSDGITESAETVTISILDPCTGAVSSTASITINDDIPPTISAADTSLCSGQSTQLNASGGLTYSWSPTTGLSNASISNPIATPTINTTYTVSMTWGACTKTASVNLYVSNPSLTATAVPAGTVCNGGTVLITANPSNGASPYNYLWSTGAITPSITVATGGTYTVTSTDAYGCTANASKTVTISNLNVTGSATNISCISGNNGAIDITVTGTNAPFTYSWADGPTSQDRTNLLTGTYTVTVSNTAGCSVSSSYTVTQPSSALTTTVSSTPISCNGGSNGTITLTVSGGASPYTYLWSNGAVTKDLAVLTAGNYTVTVTDNNGCTATRTVSITQPAAITTSETHVNETCYGQSIGSIDLSVSGGVGTYTYVWNNAATTQDISSLSAGTYSVSVADSNSCVVTRSVTITQPAGVTASPAATNPSCFGSGNGSITLTVSGGTPGYTYSWSNAATTQNISSLGAGTYSVTVKDANLCSGIATSTITQPAVLSASSTQTNVTCNGGNNGSITLTVNGGTAPYSYNWGGGITTQNRTSLAAGTYTVTATDNKGCTATASATITQPAAISFTNSNTNVSCFGGNNGSINITVSGGTSPYVFNWGGGVTTEDRSNLAVGTYSVTVTDNKACTATSSYTITQPTTLSFSQTHTNITCSGGNNGTINITISGGTSPYTYLWNGGITTQNRTGLSAGTYTLTSTDNKGCMVSASTTITQPSAINIAAAVTDATCAPGNNGAIDITVTGGSSPYAYNWGGGITIEDRTALFAGTYTVTVTDNNGCTASKAISVSQIGIGMSLSTTVTDATCNAGNNGAIDLTVTGGNPPINYNWGGGITTEDRTSLSAGNYSVTVTDGLGCSAIANSNISEPALIDISIDKTDVSCYGASTGSITTTVSGGMGSYSYNWNNGSNSQNLSNIPAGPYDLTVTDGNSCSATALAIIISQPSTAINLSASSSNVSCFGSDNGLVTLTVSGGTPGYSFEWSNGSISQNLSNVVSGSYTVTVTDNNSCSATLAAIVSQPTPALAVSFSKTDLICNGDNSGTITTSVSGGTPSYSFDWGGGVILQNRSGLAGGTYSVTVTDNNSCSTTAYATLAEPGAINITAAKTDVTCHGMNNGTITINVSGGTGAYSFVWNDTVTIQNRAGLTAGTYTVTVTDASSCTAASSSTITEPSQLTITLNSGTSVCQTPTGTATAVTNNSGTPPYTYLWSTGDSTKTINGLPPGYVSVTVTDATGACGAVDSILVGLANNNTDASFTVSGNYCGPGATINFTHTGSNNTITHYWDFGNGSPSSNFTNPSYTYSAAGTYTVTHIVNRGYCRDTVTIPITIFQKPILTSAVTNVTCNSAANGAIDLTATGTPSFIYNWGGGITTQDRSGLAPGTYTVTVTDPNACSSTLSATITQPTVLTVTNSNTNVSCNGGNNGAINLTVVGGTPAYSFNWGGGITSQNRTGLTGGTYTVTVTDANSCSSVNSISVYQPNAISIAAAVTDILCNAQSNGAINLTVTGGTGVYSYNWGGGITSQNRTSLNAGTYTITVKDANLCSATSSSTVTQPAAISTVLNTTGVTCYGGNNGSIITTNTSGGTTPYNFIWNDGSTSSNRSSLSAGNYSVTITDANSCSGTASTVVTQPSTAVNVTVNSASTLSCYGDNTGTINITASGGVPGYSYLWSDNNTLEDRTGMMGGTYFVRAMDQNGCTATTSATINQPASALSIDTILTTDVSCYGATTGSLTTIVSDGTSPYSYNWGGGVTTPNRVNVPAGNYSLTVTDNNGCSASATATIAQPGSAVTVSSSVTNVPCFSGTNGAINTTPSGGIAPYAFNWGGGVTSQNRANLSAGTYTVVVTDSNNCTISHSAVVTQPAAALSTSASVTNVSCFGGNNGTINLTTSGGTTAYAHNWNDAVTTQNRTNLPAGTYSVTITDANACTTTTSATITQPAAALSATTSVTNVACYGNSTGSITLTVAGGTTAYSYNWGGGVTSQNRINVSAGNYSVTVTDANACTTSTSATVIQPAAALNATTAITNVACYGNSTGSITLAVTGGTTAYSFIWNDAVTAQNRTNVPVGTYSVTVTDANSCSITRSVTVTQSGTFLSATVSVTNVSCFGRNNGSATVTATGGTIGYSYNWGAGFTSSIRTGLIAGTYNVTVTDANACSVSSSATVTQPSALSVSASGTNVTCNGGTNGSITLSVSGATPSYSYAWSNSAISQNLNNISSGVYSVTVRDANNCSTFAGYTVTQPSGMSVSETHTSVSCHGGSNANINITVSGGNSPYSYLWNDGATSQNRTNVQAGTYQLQVNDNSSCAVTRPIVITEPSALALILTPTHVLCNGNSTGRVTTSVNGGVPSYSYLWNTNLRTTDLTNIPAGSYSVTVSDNNMCTVSDNTNVTQPPALLVNAIKTDVNCYGAHTGKIDVTTGGGVPNYNYSWSNGAGTEDIENIGEGNYSVVVHDANSCTVISSYTITQPQGIQIASNTTPASCSNTTDGSIDITVNGGVPPMSYLWSNGSQYEDIQNAGGGNYSVNVTDNNGCTASATASVAAPAPVSLSELHVNETCKDSINAYITLSVAGGTVPYNYSWSNGSTLQSIHNISAGSYSVSVVDNNGCSAQMNSIVVTEPAALYVALTPANVACSGATTGAVNSQVTGGTTPYHYAWNNNSNTANITNVVAGNYSLTLTDANGCRQLSNGTINTLPQMQVTGIPDSLPCLTATGKINLSVTSGTPPYTYHWNTGAATEDLENINPGNYTVWVHDANGCSFDTIFVVGNLDQFHLTVINASGGGTIKLGETVDLHASATGTQVTYQWSPSFGMSCSTCSDVTVQPGQSTLYTVVSKSENGCVAQDTVSVYVIEDHTFWAPNAFTPNGDSNNDYFQVFGNLAGIRTFNVMIFNRWGEKMFESESPAFQWDGIYKGEPVPPGVFVYVMKAVFLDGHNDKIYKGSVTVVR